MYFLKGFTILFSAFFKHYKHWFAGLVTVVIISLFISALRPATYMQVLEAKTLDARFSLNKPPKTENDVALIGIDDASLKFFGDNGVSWPWPRTFYAHVLDYLTRCGARAVLFDLLFYQPDLDRSESDGEETDRVFANAISANGHVILGAQLSEEPLGFDPKVGMMTLARHPKTKPSPSAYHSILAPVPPLDHSSAGLGIINIAPDPDGIIRKVPLVYEFKDQLLPQMAVAGLLAGGSDVVPYYPGRKFWKIDGERIPLDSAGNYNIYWYGRGSVCHTLECLSFAAVIQSASASLSGEKPVLGPEHFKDKFVIIGATAAGLMDLKPTPAADISPGMEIWATILLNFIHKDFVYNVHWAWDILRAIVFAYAAFWILTRFGGLIAHGLTFLIVAALMGETIYFWRAHHLSVSLTVPFWGLMTTYLYYTALGFLVEGRSRRQISKAMSRYLHPDLVQIIAKDPDRIEMGGREVEATVLFSDIYNFTTISENFSPEELVSHLNRYFSDLSPFILDRGGMLDKYTGDGIMALFGAPLPREDHAFLACRAALDHRKFSHKLSEKISPDVSDKFHQGTRIGLHSGRIVAGNIGSTRRMDYTAIGDTVNLAARLEGVNKIYKTRIIISESCYEAVEAEFVCRELDYLRVKGKKKPTRIYELIDEKANAKKYDWIKAYERALKIYRQGNFETAAELFAVLANGSTGDSASAVMLERCRYLTEHPPENWDGILTLEVK